MKYFVYFLANWNNDVLYIGRTEDLAKRIEQHKLKQADSFTAKYNVDKLVYYEIYEDKEVAAQREWTLKKWKRQWKDDLVEKENPEWKDLYQDFLKLL